MSLLLIDSYDSFTFNLRSLLEEATGLRIVTIHNDSMSFEHLAKYLDLFVGVIIGPGPGSPRKSSDVGIIPSFFDSSEYTLPVLGICLGFQSLCISSGSTVHVLSSIKHGQIYDVHHTGTGIFKGLDKQIKCVRYHSLHIPLLSDELEELAYCEEDDYQHVIMAAKSKKNPWYGIQYHPESICSQNGMDVIKNFHEIAIEYNKANRTILNDESLLNELVNLSINPTPLLPPWISNVHYKLRYEKYTTAKSVLDICDIFHHINKEFILLNSASHPGSWTIIAIPNERSIEITHSTESPSCVKLRQNGKVETMSLDGTLWQFLASFMSDKFIPQQSAFPFIGGLIGLFSYEEGLEIQVSELPKITQDEIPDTKLLFVEDVILINTTTHETYLSTIGNQNFITKIKTTLEKYASKTEGRSSTIEAEFVSLPDSMQYKENFQKCQEYLTSGDSYELCLTTQTRLQISSEIHSWQIYKTLLHHNPAPYSCYMKFQDCILISSSPERFLKWDNSTCELRPIKGTVRKSPTMDRVKATEILNTPKELGENLMIVDLIRHDLHQMLSNVRVSKLMGVEEYATVFQLVSVIEGSFDKSLFTGIDVLSKSLPPGSMTGAPKKRSVTILQELEKGRRGMYSGVSGYWSVENKSDWSVIIRSLFHYSSDLENTQTSNTWRIGAGGAITVLSNEESEWEELLTKLRSVLQIFETAKKSSQ